MKWLFSGMIIGFLSAASVQASVYDVLDCQVRMQDIDNPLVDTTAKGNFEIVRKYFQAPQQPHDVRFKAASGSLRVSRAVPTGSVHSKLKISYTIAEKIGDRGQVIAAKVQMCSFMFSGFCQNSGLCLDENMVCGFTTDPFSEPEGWIDLTVSNGVPILDQSVFSTISSRQSLGDGKTYDSVGSCQHRGTIRDE